MSQLFEHRSLLCFAQLAQHIGADEHQIFERRGIQTTDARASEAAIRHPARTLHRVYSEIHTSRFSNASTCIHATRHRRCCSLVSAPGVAFDGDTLQRRALGMFISLVAAAASSRGPINR